MREEYSKIVKEWDEKVAVLKKQFDDLKKQFGEVKKQLSKAIYERNSVKLDLEKKLNEKILEYKSKKL